MSNYILALDQGTTSSRSILFDQNGNLIATAQKEFTQIYPQPGWVEHNPIEIWESQLSTAKEVLEKAGISAKDIKAIGITNQRETTVLWDKQTGKLRWTLNLAPSETKTITFRYEVKYPKDKIIPGL